jgi:hypothetical protein
MLQLMLVRMLVLMLQSSLRPLLSLLRCLLAAVAVHLLRCCSLHPLHCLLPPLRRCPLAVVAVRSLNSLHPLHLLSRL